MKTCQAVRAQLSQYYDGEVSPRQAGHIVLHLQQCAECRQEWARLKALIRELESDPREEAEIDLFPQFQQRLAEQRGKPRPRWAAWRFPRYAISVAAFVAVLLIGGGLAGLHSALEQRLYISTPRQLQPALFTSMAVAAKAMQNDEDADGLLSKDPRLGALIDVQAHGETLGQVMAELINKTSLHLAIDEDLARQRVYLRLHNVSIATVLGELRRVTSGAWELSSERDGKYYTLLTPPTVLKVANAVAEAQALSAAGESLCNARKSTWSSTPHEMPIDHLLDDEMLSTLLAGKSFSKRYSSMTPQQQTLFRRWLDGDMPKPGRNWEKTWVDVELKRDWNGTVQVHTSMENEDSADEHNIEMTCLKEEEDSEFTPYAGWQLTEFPDDTDLLPVMLEPSERAVYKDAALAVKLKNSKDNAYTMLEMLDLIAQHADFQIVSDYFTVEEQVQRKLPRNISLGVLLYILDKDYNIAWSLDDHHTLRLVHRQWPMLRQTEPGEGVDRAASNFARCGFLELDDLVTVLRQSDLQLVGTGQMLQYDSDKLHDLRSRLNGALDYYAELSPAQQQAARSTTGLSSTTMNARESARAYEACRKVWADTPNALLDASKPLTFSVLRRAGTWGELEKFYRCPFVSRNSYGSTDFTALKLYYYPQDANPVSLTVKHEFLILRWSGAMNSIIVIQLPAKGDPGNPVSMLP